jgi:hypothetical protein
MRRFLLSSTVAALVLGFIATPKASAQQSFNIYLGGFIPSSFDARGGNDVIFADSAFLSTPNRLNNGLTGIDMGRFNGATVGGEYLVGLGRNFEAGLGIGYYQRTVGTIYTALTDPQGNDIAQDLKLRIVPFTATARFLPLGHNAPLQPYVGGGVAVYSWRYSETGSFVDLDNNIFTGTFVGSGGAVGPVVLGGVRVPIGAARIGGEIRWQGGSATLPSDQDFAGSKIYLGGFNYLFVFNVMF